MRTGFAALAGAWGGRSGLRAAALALLALAPAAATAQGVDCGRLQSQLASARSGTPAQAARFVAAANKQQAEVERTAAYAQSIGCNNRQFLIFGSAPPPQCGAIMGRLGQMRSNVASLQGQAQAASGAGLRGELQARYETYCRGGAQGSRGLFDTLFGAGNERVQIPIEEDPRSARPREEAEDRDERPRGGSMAVCVRTCDGGFFPVSYSARRSNTEDLEEMCKALCPNVEAALFTYSPSRDIDQAVSADGEPYSALKNAGKYRTKFDPACTCKPPHKSWVEALADAEALLGRKAKSDILVTPEKSAEMSRGKAPLLRGRTDPAATAEAPAAAAAPAKAFGLTDGTSRDDVAADGARKRVRVIDPKI